MPLYEVCLIRIKEEVGEKRSTVCTHRYADCLLKKTVLRKRKKKKNGNTTKDVFQPAMMAL
jgi:hypothetical protein